MTVARPPQPSGDNFKTWGTRLNEYLVRTRSQLVQFTANASAVDDGMLVWDADNSRVLYSSGGAWIPIAGTGGNPASLFYNGSAKITATADGVTALGNITLSGFPESDYELKGDIDGAVRFHAVATEALSKGDVVYIVEHASSGSETKVAKALASDAAKMPAFGLALDDAAIDAAIQIVTFGNLYGSGGAGNALDTSAYNSGTPLYVSATTAGEWTGTAPASESNLVQNIGKVVRKQQTNGVIKVGGAGRTNATPNLNDGNIFIGNSSNQAVTASLATQVSALETSHSDVLVDGDFTSNGFMKRDSAGVYSVDGNTYLTTHQDISGKADLSGAAFTGNVSIGGTFNTDDITSTINSVDYPVYSTSLDGSNPIATLGGTAAGNKVHTLEMRPAAGGVRIHWHQNTDNIAGQTLRLHTTDRGIHVGDDRTGTYTAGDNQSNADLDFGMLVGRESANLGSNNFGFGYDVDFSVDTASNLGVGSLIDVLEDTTNSVAFGGDVKLGKSVSGVETGVTGSLVGGNLARTQGNYSFTWGKGELDSNGVYPTVNEGYGCVLFGHITEIDSGSNWCLAGGGLGNSNKTKISNSNYSLAWGSFVTANESHSTAIFGLSNQAKRASNSLISGANNDVFASGCIVSGTTNVIGYDINNDTRGSNSACFGVNHLAEGSCNLVAGNDNNTLGNSGACIGQGLKTPLFQPVGGGDYVWDDYSVVVGGYNDEANKYYTNTNSTAWVEDHRFVVGTGTSSNAKDNGFIVAVPDSGFCGIIMPNLASSPPYTNDLNAKAGGVPVGGLYRDGNTVKIVLS